MGKGDFEIDLKEGIVYFHMTESALTTSGVKEISEAFEHLSKKDDLDILIVNQIKLGHTLTPAEDKAWIELYRHLPQYVNKTATICHDVVNKLQVNYIFQKEGVSNRFKAFVEEEETEVCKFLGIDRFEL